MKLPATPPSPLHAVTAAAVTARFHWLRDRQLCVQECEMGKLLPSDVVSLVAVQSCPVGDVCTSGQVHTNIANCDLIRETQHREACYKTYRVE